MTCNSLWWWSRRDNSGYGGVSFSLLYTSKDPKNDYYWVQTYSENGGPDTYDNSYNDWDGVHNTGSNQYYSPEELAKHIIGNTIKYWDRPQSPDNNYNIKFTLKLYKANSVVLTIQWGYKIDNNGNTIIYYPKILKPN